MDRKEERLIRESPENEEEGAPQKESLFANPLLWTVIKVSLSLGVITSLLTGLILVRARLVTAEEALALALTRVEKLEVRQEKIATGVKQLNKITEGIQSQVNTLDIGAAKGDLKEALEILHIQSENFDKQLAVTRNGMMSLSRMVKGSRVWQDDYRSQYEALFKENTKLKETIKALRGIQQNKEEPPQYIEIDF